MYIFYNNKLYINCYYNKLSKVKCVKINHFFYLIVIDEKIINYIFLRKKFRRSSSEPFCQSRRYIGFLSVKNSIFLYDPEIQYSRIDDALSCQLAINIRLES
jgi:hypothetical protein